MFKLLIDNGKYVFEPPVCGEVLYESFYRGRAGKISFNVADKSGGSYAIKEGSSVSLKVNGDKLFFGVVFICKKSSDGVVSVTAYDQIRYLKNKDTYTYTEKRASDVIRMIAGDYLLRVGDISQTEYVIPSRVEDNVSLLDIIESAIDLELEHKGKRFTLFDDFGRLSLKSENEMFSGVVINKNTASGFRYVSSVDNRFNRVKLSRSDGKTGRREFFFANDEKSESEIGVLQYYAKASSDENGGEKARSLLALYNKTEKELYISDAIGDSAVRGGAVVKVSLSDYGFSGNARVQRCVHKLSANHHFMDLDILL